LAREEKLTPSEGSLAARRTPRRKAQGKSGYNQKRLRGAKKRKPERLFLGFRFLFLWVLTIFIYI